MTYDTTTKPHSRVKSVYAKNAQGDITMATNEFSGVLQLSRFALEHTVVIIDSDGKHILVKGN